MTTSACSARETAGRARARRSDGERMGIQRGRRGVGRSEKGGRSKVSPSPERRGSPAARRESRSWRERESLVAAWAGSSARLTSWAGSLRRS